MASIKFSRKEFEDKVGKLTEELKEKISMMGTHVENVTADEIELEILPNRPDLFSLHGFMRAFASFLGKKTGLKAYKTKELGKNYGVVVDESVLEVRPYTACAVVKGMKFDDNKIKEVIDIQEKLHATLGRNRRKIAIGIYPLEKIKLPIKFEARKPEEIKFVPLEATEEMSGRQILKEHPAGREYAHLLEYSNMFPVFVDDAGEILSMPPIINSHKTGKITTATKEIFIECSGFDLPVLKKTLNILATMFADMGGEIYQMKVRHKNGNYTTPDLEPEKIKINLENANKLLGLELTERQMAACLEKMGYDCKKGLALAPPWRADILHEQDLIEDIAIAYGYDKFEPEIPNISFAGESDKTEIQKKRIAELLAGLNMLEISSYHLTTASDQFKKVSQKKENFIEVKESKTEYNILRKNLLHYALKALSENIDAEYPQRIFELGRVFEKDTKGESETGVREAENLCIAVADNSTGFTEIKQILNYLMKMLGKEGECKIEPAANSFFIDGRCGKIIVGGAEIGHIGEISPVILSNLKIKMPVSALEIGISFLF